MNQAGLAFGHDNQGHVQGGEYDALWAKDGPALRVSFGYSSEHAMAQAAKAIITAYYGKPPAYSYFEGCSDGGHEALVDAQRYPRDFNGILAGAPGNIEAQLLAVVPAWLISVNTGPAGHAILTSEKLPALHSAVLKACGDASGLIDDPRSCGFDPASIQCPPGTDTATCLTPAQTAGNELLGALMQWTEHGTAPSTMSFPLLQPTAALAAITARSLDPLTPPPGGTRGLNTQYHWAGRPGDELWCSTQGMDLTCTHNRSQISYWAGTGTHGSRTRTTSSP